MFFFLLLKELMIISNTTNEGKDNTSLAPEGITQGKTYNISVTSFSRFNNVISIGRDSTTNKSFILDSASGISAPSFSLLKLSV